MSWVLAIPSLKPETSHWVNTYYIARLEGQPNSVVVHFADGSRVTYQGRKEQFLGVNDYDRRKDREAGRPG
jgi:hypothetical protein